MGITVNLKTMTIWDYNNIKFTWNITRIPGFNACKLFKFQTQQYDILTLWPVANSHSHRFIVTDTTFSLWFNTNTLATDHKLQKSSNFHVKITYLWTKVFINLGGKNPLLFLFNAPFGCRVNVTVGTELDWIQYRIGCQPKESKQWICWAWVKELVLFNKKGNNSCWFKNVKHN